MNCWTDRFQSLEEPQKRGQATESLVKAAFTVRDHPVLLPESDNEPYDLVVDIDGRFLRIQAKTGYGEEDGTVTFETVSTRTRSDGYERRGYDESAIDYFAVYSPERNEVYLVHVEEAAAGKMQLRFAPTRNGQCVGVNWCSDYHLDIVLNGIKSV